MNGPTIVPCRVMQASTAAVSKSIVGCVTAVLADRGRLDPGAPVTTYLPELSGSGYDGATDCNLLDMRTGVAFRETYTAPDAEVRVMERSMGWRPPLPGDPAAPTRTWPRWAGPARMAPSSATGRPTPTCSAGRASGPTAAAWPTWSPPSSGSRSGPSVTP
jgi:Beta-lactamase